MITIENLVKRYGTFTAVDGISLEVPPGEIHGFLGPNGAGKTTTMRILTGYMPATEGKATVAGYDVFDQPIEAKKRTGYLPETPPLYPDMTVREYLRVVREARVSASTSAHMDLEAVIDRAGIVTGVLTGVAGGVYAGRSPQGVDLES